LLAAFWRGLRLVALQLWRLVPGSILRQYFHRVGAMGLVAISLWRLDFLAGLRLGLGAHWLWFWRACLLPAGDGCMGSQRQHARHCSSAPGRQARQDRAKSEPGNSPRPEFSGCAFHACGGNGKMVGPEEGPNGSDFLKSHGQCAAVASVADDRRRRFGQPRRVAWKGFFDFLRPA
jgi:hypothetical protein